MTPVPSGIGAAVLDHALRTGLAVIWWKARIDEAQSSQAHVLDETRREA